MRFERLWVVAKKDLAEIRTSRYVMATVIVMPLLFAIVIPVTTFLPLMSLPSEETPLPLRLELTTTVADQTLGGVALSNASVERSVVSNGTISGSFVGNSTLKGVLVVDSVLFNVTVRGSVVRGSNLYNATVDDETVLINSIVVGKESPFRQIITLLFGFLQLFFILIPVMVPTVMASYTIVGEKANRSLEPLLASPLSDEELLAGKSLAIFLPSMGATWGAFGIFGALVLALFSRPGMNLTPDATWLISMFVLAPLVCVLSIAINVLISSRVTDVRASQQLGGLVVLPVLFFFLAGVSGLFVLGPLAMFLFAAMLAGIDVAVFLLAVKVFDREEILVRWK